MNIASINEITELMRHIPDEFSKQVREAVEDILDIAETNYRIRENQPSISLDEVLKKCGLSDDDLAD